MFSMSQVIQAELFIFMPTAGVSNFSFLACKSSKTIWTEKSVNTIIL